MKRPVAEHGSKTQGNWRRTSKLFAIKHPFGRLVVIEVLSQVYLVGLMENGRVFQWSAQKARFDYLIMKFDLISVILRLHGLSTVFRNFPKNVKTPEPKTYITILSIL